MENVWIQGALPLSSCVTLGRLLSLSELQFRHRENGSSSYTCPRVVLRIERNAAWGATVSGTLQAGKGSGEEGQILQGFSHRIRELGM